LVQCNTNIFEGMIAQVYFLLLFLLFALVGQWVQIWDFFLQLPIVILQKFSKVHQKWLNEK